MPKRVLQGVVVSDKREKTVTVSVERRVMHPVYKKFIRRSKKYAAHDETNQYKVGQTVEIRECRPLSRTKTWEVIGVVAGSGSAKTVEKSKSKPKTVKKGNPKAAAKAKAKAATAKAE